MNYRKDITQIHRDEHDAVSGARKVRLIDTELALELDHLDGDSVTSHPDKLVVSSMGVSPEDIEIIPAISCSSLKKVQLYAEIVSGLKDCKLVIQVSPVDSGDVWFDISSLTGNTKCGSIVDICARRLRVLQTESNATSEINVHLVGQG